MMKFFKKSSMVIMGNQQILQTSQNNTVVYKNEIRSIWSKFDGVSTQCVNRWGENFKTKRKTHSKSDWSNHCNFEPKRNKHKEMRLFCYFQNGVYAYICVYVWAFVQKKFDCINRKKEIYSTFQKQKQKKIKTNEKLNRINDDTDVRVRVWRRVNEQSLNNHTIQKKRLPFILFTFFLKKKPLVQTQIKHFRHSEKNIQRTYTKIELQKY